MVGDVRRGAGLTTLNIQRRLSWQLWADAVAVVLMAAGFWASARYGLSVELSVLLYSIAIVVLYAWLFVACRRAIVLALER